MQRIAGSLAPAGIVFAAMLAGILAGCVTPREASLPEKIRLSREVWGDFEMYRQAVGETRRGFFAVSENGTVSAAYWCVNTVCREGTRKMSINQCEFYSKIAGAAQKCFIFAIGQEPQLPYEIAP